MQCSLPIRVLQSRARSLVRGGVAIGAAVCNAQLQGSGAAFVRNAGFFNSVVCSVRAENKGVSAAPPKRKQRLGLRARGSNICNSANFVPMLVTNQLCPRACYSDQGTHAWQLLGQSKIGAASGGERMDYTGTVWRFNTVVIVCIKSSSHNLASAVKSVTLK